MITQIASNNTRKQLFNLLSQDLAFHKNGKSHLIHSLHAFAARFPPPLPSYFIQGLSLPGETVLDPTAGSGATLVEGWLLSRNVIGVDLDPLALRLCRTTTTSLDPSQVYEAGQRVLDTALLWNKMGDSLAFFLNRIDDATHEFIDYWFKPETQRELSALALAVQEEPDLHLRRLLEILISSIIVTKSGGVSMARDLAHSRPHRVENKTPRNAIKMFEAQLRQAVQAFQEMRNISRGHSTVLASDCRHLPLTDESIDLIVTSPPYANALDYMRAHKFSLVWLGEAIKPSSVLRGKYIGTERLAEMEDTTLPKGVEAIIDALTSLDAHKAKVLAKYFYDMSFAIKEMYRVIRPGRAAIIVVGPSTMRGLPIETHKHLASIAQGVGFKVAGVMERPLDRDKRMMPARWYNKGQSMIEQRTYHEFVIGLLKL